MGLNEGIVDSHDIDVAVLNGIAEDDATNTTEAVDSHLCRGHDALWLLYRRSAEVVVGYERDDGRGEKRARGDEGSLTKMDLEKQEEN